MSINFIWEVMSIFSFKVRKYKSDFPRGKTAQKFLDGKGVSAPQKLSDFFKKMVSKNNDFSCKNMKNT